MKAAVWTGPGRIETRQVPDPAMDDGEVRVRLRAAGFCGTDVHIISGELKVASPPLILGHEFAGEVVEVGSRVRGVRVGTRAAVDSYLNCGRCEPCARGRKHICKSVTEYGVDRDGGWAEYVVVKPDQIHALPENVSYEEAAAMCVLNCPLASVRKVGIELGESVLILGDGPASLVFCQLVKLRGAGRVVLTGHHEHRLDLARRLGADHVLNTLGTHLEAAARDLLPGGPQVVIDAVGSEETLQAALSLVRSDGRICLFGVPVRPLQVPLVHMVYKTLTMVSATGAPDLWEVGNSLVARGLVQLKPLITHTFPLERAMDAYELVRGRADRVIKVVFVM